MPIKASTILEQLKPLDDILYKRIDQLLCMEIEGKPPSKSYYINLPKDIKSQDYFNIVCDTLEKVWNDAGWNMQCDYNQAAHNIYVRLTIKENKYLDIQDNNDDI